MFLVTGITGRVGASVAQHLLAEGKQVRAFVRDRAKASVWADQGVELFDGDLNDADSLARALQGVDGAYLMIPPSYTPSPDFKEAKGMISAFAAALKAVPLSRLVVLSSNGAEKTSGLGAITPLSLLEQRLRNLPFPSVFVRPGSFYENFLFGLQAGRTGVLPLFYSNLDDPHPMTAIEDIGAEVARLLTGAPWMGRRVIELGSMVTPNTLVAQLGEVLHQSVQPRCIPREQWVPTLLRMGFKKEQTWAFEEIYDGVNTHWIGFGAEGSERVEGTITARDVFAAHNSNGLK